MTLQTIAQTTRTGARKVRVSHLLAALGGATLTLVAVTALGQLTGSAQRPAAPVVAAPSRQHTSFVQPRGGQAELIAAGNSTAHSAVAVQTSAAPAAVPAQGGFAEAIAAAQVVAATSRTPSIVFARGGMAEALDARRASAVATALPATPSADGVLPPRAKGGRAEALDAARLIP